MSGRRADIWWHVFWWREQALLASFRNFCKNRHQIREKRVISHGGCPRLYRRWTSNSYQWRGSIPHLIYAPRGCAGIRIRIMSAKADPNPARKTRERVLNDWIMRAKLKNRNRCKKNADRTIRGNISGKPEKFWPHFFRFIALSQTSSAFLWIVSRIIFST